MNSCQLLRETQRAAGDEKLTEWHDTLIAAGKELKAIQDVRISPIPLSFTLASYGVEIFG